MKNKKRYVFLDDLRNPIDCFNYTHNSIYIDNEWTIVRNYNEFIEDTLKNGLADFYSFDHDLADIHYEELDIIDYSKYTEKTGFHCAKWLIDYCIDNNLNPPNYTVHSMNSTGRKNILSIIENYKKFLKK